MDAAARGADIRVRTEVVVGAARASDHWRVELRDAVFGPAGDGAGARAGQRHRRLGRRCHRHAGSARTPIAERPAGEGQPHRGAAGCSSTTAPTSSRTRTRRIVFAIPYEQDFTLIGTTDVDFAGDLDEGRHLQRGDRLSVRGGERVLHRRHRAVRRGVELRRRAAAVRRRRGLGAEGDARLRARARRAGRRRARCSTSSAARSRPTGTSPRKR